MSNITADALRVTRRTLEMSRELLSLVEAFDAHGIPALPYKGPVLASAEYGNLASRTFCDLDILVKREDVPRARGALIARGYVPEYQLSSGHERVWLRARHEINLRHPEKRVTVELHWDIVLPRQRVRFDLDRLWSNTRTVALGGRDVRTLSAENLLLVLCVHGAKHAWTRQMWIDDVAAVVASHPAIDWTDVFHEASRMGVRRMLTVGLRLAAATGRCRLPDDVRDALDEPQTVRLTRDVQRWLSSDAAGSEHPFRRSVFHLRIRERIRDKIRVGFTAVVVPSDTDRLVVALPPVFAGLYYALRPLRLARKYSQRAWFPSFSR